MTVNGRTLWDNNRDAPRTTSTERSRDHAVRQAIQDRTPASPSCAAILPRRRDHQALGRDPGADEARGRAVVFENIEEFHARIDDDSLT